MEYIDTESQKSGSIRLPNTEKPIARHSNFLAASNKANYDNDSHNCSSESRGSSQDRIEPSPSLTSLKEKKICFKGTDRSNKTSKSLRRSAKVPSGKCFW